MTEQTNSNTESDGEETINILEMTAHFKEVLDKKEAMYNDLAKIHNSLFKRRRYCYSSTIRYIMWRLKMGKNIYGYYNK